MYEVGKIIEVKVSGIEPYGIFVKAADNYTGLIHISEIDNNFVKDIHRYVEVNDVIYAIIVGIDVDKKHLNLSIKNMNYNNNDGDRRKIKENLKGFLPLYNNLDDWINDKVRELKGNNN